MPPTSADRQRNLQAEIEALDTPVVAGDAMSFGSRSVPDDPIERGAVEALRRERDLYRKLLDLGSCQEISAFLSEALHWICEISEAHQGYLELRPYGGAAEPDATPWWTACGFDNDELGEVRAALSSGIVQAAIQSGELIVTDSALLDRRFSENKSVRDGAIAAVLCAPIGGAPPFGVLYLQRSADPKPFRPEDRELIEMVTGHLGRNADRLLARQAMEHSRDPVSEVRRHLRADGLVGHSQALADVLEEVRMVAPLDVSVLLTGESGTGKSQLARTIHGNSPRARHRLVEINCAAIPEALIESELFGALPGAHSTARTRIQGKVAAAEGGTLFLDEIGELPLALQAKLLQLLQSRVYYPLGGTRTVSADVRILAASNADLERAVQEKTFRDDLFYRLQVVPIRVPSLAERREDIPALARHFVGVATERHRLPKTRLSRNAEWALGAAQWPGNIRQLENAIEAATIRAARRLAENIEVNDIFPPSRHPSVPLTFQEATRRFQAGLIDATLKETAGSVVEAAKRLDLARSHVYGLIKAFGLSTKSKSEH